MKKLFFTLLLGGLCFSLDAQTVGTVTAQTTRMSPHTLVQRFRLKPGDPFSPALYEKAQDDLHKLRVFKKLDFTATPNGEKTDIHINAQDGYYIFPLAFYTGGAKSAGGATVYAGNLFKHAEHTFLFVGGSRDGFTARAGLQIGNHFFSNSYTKKHIDQNFYNGHWQNVQGIFSTADDEDHAADLLRSVRMRQEEMSFLYRYRFSRTGSFLVTPTYNHLTYGPHQLDSGNHHTVRAGLQFSDDIRAGMNMGALAGYGLSDKQKSLQDLPRARHGYLASISYENGGRWTDSDYEISKLDVQGAWLLEQRGHHLLMVQTHAQHAFEAPFSNEVTSTEILPGTGKYSRQFRGKRAVGAGVSFAYYLLRNQTGLLSLAPFYELSYTDVGPTYRPHSGAGANLFYRLWRFPFPVGLNYTHNLQDGSRQIGFVIGGAF